GRHDDVGTLEVLGKVFGAAVANGDGGVGFLQQHGHRQAHNVGPPHDDRFSALGGHARIGQQFHAARRGTGNKERVTPLHRQTADIHRVKTIYIFFQVDGIEHRFFVDV